MRRPLTSLVDAMAPSVGSITNISLIDVRSTHVVGARGTFASTMDGQPIDKHFNVKNVYPVGPDITLDNVEITYPGGGSAKDVNNDPPHEADTYQPRKLGARPAYGFFLRHAIGITFNNVKLGSEKPDGRPALILDHTDDVTLKRVSAERGTGQAWDVGVRNATVPNVSDSPQLVVKDLYTSVLI